MAELYGFTSQTLSINHPDGGHIAWLGFIESNDYNYFKITKVQVGSTTIVSDGSEIDGELYTASSNSIISDIDVNAGESSGYEYSNGSISVAGSADLKITIQYSPLMAIESEDQPHEAYLIINYDSPQVGSTRLKLEGVTKGAKAEKCTQDPSTMEVIEYKIKNSAFDMYFCSAEVAKKNQNNTPQDTADPGYHGASTNIVSIPMDSDAFTFYQVDDETVCVLSDPTPTISPFVLPIPEGLAPITTMDISLTEGSYAECSLDVDGNILCPANILVDALVSLSGMTLTNTGFAAEDLVTTDCPDFGAISGSGAFGDAEMNLIFMGKTLSDMNTEEYHIVDSLIVANIGLEQ
ncbi:MAG: hypothetical protein ACD_62C00114G0002 [uncultured bacterium]|nr:MAG: hypothetical protein ACD_62C00114G0002 [uncultured bacterium]